MSKGNYIEIFEDPLSDKAYLEHVLGNKIRKTPAKYHLIDIIKDLKAGRPVENQKMMDEWIAMMELVPERGEPFSAEIVNMVFGA